MTQIIFTAAAGVLFLVGLSLFFVWLEGHSQKRFKKKLNDRFQFFDKYYVELEKESEDQQEKKRKERMEALGYTEEKIKEQPENA